MMPRHFLFLAESMLLLRLAQTLPAGQTPQEMGLPECGGHRRLSARDSLAAKIEKIAKGLKKSLVIHN
jgi:hypothetical protein